MTCKSKERFACITYKNESTCKRVGVDHNGKVIFERDINFVENRCPNENECTVRGGEPRGLKLMK